MIHYTDECLMKSSNLKALIALKKGTQLIKYCRKGKPKFRPFRLSTDETTLIWCSHGEEKSLKLTSVSKIIPGQRTAVFRRYSRPEKDYLSFSLIYYKNGERSLDLICKDQAEVEVWLAGLNALVSNSQQRVRRTRSEVPDWHDSSESFQNGHISGSGVESAASLSRGRVSVDWCLSSDVRSEANMQLRTSNVEGFRISVSSTPSCSSQGSSGPDDIESLGDVYIWGELWSKAASSPDGSANPFSKKIDILTPKPLESNVVLDVHQIACGVRHVALVTRQGEVFTWGEESGGRLGHGVERDFTQPRLVEFLAVTNVDFVSCGEFHTSAISTSGDLFTWGDGTQNAGLLGHGTDVSHWIPKRISGPLEGLQVLSIACGTWHSALVTSNGKLFTFGDGAFGALGHGDRENVPQPKEVERLSGLKTIKIACGLWHTAAIVEMNPSATGAVAPSRKLFTWGDGDKYRLGHGSKETYLVPTSVSALIGRNFHQIACGHTLTVALATSGHVYTMGSNAHGQLGNPQAEGKIPDFVQDKLVGEFVEEISCGAHHVAVLTSRSEVYTWGKGANGRLGHGDTEDRKSPTLVEALRDRNVKNVSCGSNFTASICIHKWVSGADQSICSGCRQAFGFTRKRHNCYNCGLVHCHACSSRKAVRAALAPTPGKPHRVCDACYNKLKATNAGNVSSLSKRNTAPRFSIDSSRERPDKGSSRSSSRVLLSPTTEPVKYLEVKSQRMGVRSDSVSMIRASQVPAFQQLKDIAFPSSLSAIQTALKPVPMQPSPPPPPAPSSSSRPASPYSRRPSPPRSGTPVFSRGVIDSLKKSNDLLGQEVAKLQNQVKTLKQKCDFQDLEILKLQKIAKEATLFASEQSSECKLAKEVVKSITTQLKELADEMPSEILESEAFKTMQIQVSTFVEANDTETSESQSSSLPEETASDPQNVETRTSMLNEANSTEHSQSTYHVDSSEERDSSQDGIGESAPSQGVESSSDNVETNANQVMENGVTQDLNQPSSSETSSHHSSGRSEGARERTELFEPGVYVTYIQPQSGAKVFRRVRFSKRRFSEQQAEEWWKENNARVLRAYAPPPSNTVPTPTHSPPPPPPPPPPPDETNEEATS